MIRALMLIFDPVASWDSIVARKRGWLSILITYLLPLWVIACVAEFYGLVHWGKPRGFISEMKRFTHSQALVFEIIQLILMFVLVFVGAKLIKALGETFHGRNTFDQTFTVTAYGLGPIFTMRIFDIFPSVSGWVYWATWGVGALMTFAILYHGIPKVMLPDPPSAFGLYLTSTILLLMVSGLIRFLTFSYLEGRFGKLDAFIDKVISALPFLEAFNRYHFFQ